MGVPRDEEVQKNYAAFITQLPELIKNQSGKYALMKNEEIVEFFDTIDDAAKAGERLYPDGIYSVQLVEDSAVQLGYFSNACS